MSFISQACRLGTVGLAWFKLVALASLAWLGLAWLGFSLAWLGLAWLQLGLAWRFGLDSPGLAWLESGLTQA